MGAIVDLVADVGEGFGAYRMGDDDALLNVVTSANIACGFHAGDPRIMDGTVRACTHRGVAVGAHPGFPDLAGFGRRAMDLTFEEVRSDTLYQVGALQAFAAANGTHLAHVTPHGRLGNLVVTDRKYAEAVADAVASYNPSLIVLTQEGELADVCRKQGLPLAILGLADRAYQGDGTLVRRSEPGAVISDKSEVAERAVRMVTDGVVTGISGGEVPVACDSVLLHGDTPGAIELARSVREQLVAAGVEIASLAMVLAAKDTTGNAG